MKIRKAYALFLLTGAALSVLWSCGSANPDAPAFTGGKHPATWITDHRTAFQARPSQCYECHGTDLKGGISGVSCFSANFNGLTCHAAGPVIHPAGWSDPLIHGPHAKAAVSGADGLSTCQACHGTLFDGGIGGLACASCHGVAAPHPARPWRGGTFSHTTTDETNAATCALCHTAGNNLPLQLRLAAYITGTPGCFNSTLCHGSVEAHPAQWPAHNQAADIPARCQTCHGVQLQGTPLLGSSACASCHVALAAGAWPILGQCVSCHGKPPATGRHQFHLKPNEGGLTDCSPCHFGVGTGTAGHGTRAAGVVIFSSDAGANATYNSTLRTCKNIDCHGGGTRTW